jgi:predicted amidophosphoribosyltransferase
MCLARDRIIEHGIRLVPAFEHGGAARDLIHHLKYRGIGGYPELVARTVARRLPTLPVAPIPRAYTRHLKYGVDAARLIANALAGELETRVMNLFYPQLHTKRRAGRDHTASVPTFVLKDDPPQPVILVDDVYTTGATVSAAIESIGADRVFCVVVANAAELSNLSIGD